MNFKPLGNRVLIKQTEEENKTGSGIILVDSSKEKPKTGKALAIGKNVEGVNVGDMIVFGKFAGTDIYLDGDQYLIINGDDIQGVILNKE